MGSSPVPVASADAAVTGVTAEAVELNLGLSIGGTAAEGATSPASSPPAEAMLYNGEMTEQQWRREYNAFRRRELRRKQEEKQMRKAAGAARQKTHEKVHKDGTAAAADPRSDNSGGSPAVFSPAPISVRHTKTNPSVNEPPPATVGYAAAAAIPVIPMPCYSPMHYVAPYAGSPYGFPYVVPYWAAPVVPQAEAADVEVETRIIPPVAAVGVPVVTGKEVEVEVDERSSSDMSDFLDLSFKDVPGVSKSSSSGTKSESSVTVATADDPKPAQQQDTIPYHTLPSPKNYKKNACPIKLHLLEELEGASSVTQKSPDPNCSINKRKKSDEYMDEKRDEKEEKMPCVAARGDGPEGKIITGFLYRYTEGEVSIMCVCHGRSFSPAEFLRHAGSSETSQPLRHIVVVPSHRQEAS